MRVLFVNLVYGVGSTGKIIADIADLLRKGGSDVRILYGAGADSSDAGARRTAGSLEYYAHNVLSRLTDHAGLYSRAATRRMIREIKTFQPDLIHLHTLHGFYVNYEMLFRFLKGSGIPVVWTLHDCWPFTGHRTHFSQIKCTQWQTECQDCRLLRRYLHCYGKGDVRRNFRRKKDAFTGVKNPVITTPSQWLASQVALSFLRDYPRMVIPNGIDRTVFRPQASDLWKSYRLEDKKIVLGVASTWSAQKGLPGLLALTDRLGADYQVVLIGLTAQQLPHVPPNVLGLPRTANQTELAQWYTVADVFVNPTYEDTFPTVDMEAQSCGAPAAVYETDGCPETLVTGNSVLTAQGDLDGLEHAVRDVVRRGVRVAPCETERFDKEWTYGEYIRLYERMCGDVG